VGIFVFVLGLSREMAAEVSPWLLRLVRLVGTSLLPAAKAGRERAATFNVKEYQPLVTEEIFNFLLVLV
jgi:hypothetical protein